MSESELVSSRMSFSLPLLMPWVSFYSRRRCPGGLTCREEGDRKNERERDKIFGSPWNQESPYPSL